MEEELVLIKQVQETGRKITSLLSRCEKKMDNELMELMSGTTKRLTEGMLIMPRSPVLSRVVEKLLALLHQEPATLVGVEEQVEWIESELRSTTWYGDSHEFTVELGDVAYDLEDALDNLQSKSAAQESRKGKLFVLLHSKLKKAARQIQDKFRLVEDHLKGFESSGEQGNKGMVRMKELLTISSSAVDVMEEFISRGQQGVFDMGNLDSDLKVAREMEQICSKILEIKKGDCGLPLSWSVDLPEDEEENIKIRNMSLTGVVMRWGDVGDMTKSVASRAILKLTALLVQEPVGLYGVEEHVQWIQEELRGIVIRRRFTEEAIDVAYDVEDYMDSIILKSSSQARNERNLEGEIVSDDDDDDQLQKKMERITHKIRALPPPEMEYSVSSRAPFTETDWLKLSLVLDQNMTNTVVSPVIEKVAALLAQESLPPRAKKSARRVRDKFKLMNGFLGDLESEELDDKGMAWMEELCHVSMSTKDIIDQFMKSREQEKGRYGVGPLGRDVLGFAHLISQHKLARKMDHIYAKIQGLSIRRPQVVCDHSDQRAVLPTNTPPNPQDQDQEPDFISFGDDVHRIMRKLLSDDAYFSVISIVGMPGIGKTTLAKLIYNNKAVVDHFPFRAWTSATDWGELFKDIMGQDFNQKAPRSWKRQKLNAFLTGKKYLIVLEDSYVVNFLKELISTLPGASNGSRMILTTSTTKVASRLERGIIHCVRLRVDDESWALFTHVLKANISPEMLKLKREIVRKCGGLPLAIVKLANALSQKDTTYSIALQQLNQDQQQLWSYTLSRISDDLPLHMQRCLYHLCRFPQDFEIPARRLINLWIAEGLVETEGKNEALEDTAERYLTTLIDKAIIIVTKNKLNEDVKTCVLPDALRQYWSSKAPQTKFLQVDARIAF